MIGNMSEDSFSDYLGHQINVELSDKVIAKLNNLAEEQKTNINELINRLLEASIDACRN